MTAVCPECRDGKHGNCIGYALDVAKDVVVDCECDGPDCGRAAATEILRGMGEPPC